MAVLKERIMQIITQSSHHFLLVDDVGALRGELIYSDHYLQQGVIQAGGLFLLTQVATGQWNSVEQLDYKEELRGIMKVSTGSIITTGFINLKLNYRFKRIGGWRLRFVVLNSRKEELMSILPSIHWTKKTYEFVLQLNDDFKKECSPLLILHMLHCANCGLSMINGGVVPALISL